MSTRLTDHDYELLSAYLDGALLDSERLALEARLQAEPDLRRELEALRQTVALVKGLPTLKAPRNFTIDGNIARHTRLLIFPTTALFSALSAAAAVLLLVLGGVFLFQQGQLAAPAPIEQQAAQDVAVLPSQTLDSTSTADTTSQRGFTSLPTQRFAPTQTAPAVPSDSTSLEAYGGAGSDATTNTPLSENVEPLAAAPQPTGIPEAASAAGEAESSEEAQDSMTTDEVQADTAPADNGALTFAPTIQPPANGLTSTDDRQTLEETATSLSAEFAVLQQEQITATPSATTAATLTLPPTQAPAANEIAQKQPQADNLVFAGVLFAAGVALLLIAIATSLVRWRRR